MKRAYATKRQRRAVGILVSQVLDKLQLVVVRVRDYDDSVGVVGTSKYGDADRVLKFGIAALAVHVAIRELN